MIYGYLQNKIYREVADRIIEEFNGDIKYKEWRKDILERQLNLIPCTHDCLYYSAREDFSAFAELSEVIDFDTMLEMEIKYDFYEDSEKDEIERFLK